MEDKTEVLVVGAGPTGLTMAIMLRRLGIGVRIVDRAAQPSAVSKALAIWSGSLEALDGTGAVEAMLAEGRKLRALSVGQGDRELASMAVGTGIDSPYPFPLLLAQSRTEQLLGDRLADLGATVERRVELTGLAQDGTGVTARLRHADGREEAVRAAYLVGCDGARSAVRHALGIAFEGYTEPDTYILGDVHIDGAALDDRSIYIRWGRGGTIALFPYGDAVWRLFARRGPSPAGEDAPATLEELQAQAVRFGMRGMRLRDPSWLSTFRINERLAARYRDGRCFLAGDAAHIHSPAGGQGMNTGIQDAFNLGWKLACALRGHGDAALLLDSYEPERRPVARKVVDESAQRLHVAFAGGTAARLLRSAVVAVMGRLKVAQRKLQVQLSETELTYRDGPLVRLGEPPARPRRTEVGGRARDAEYVDPETGRTARLWPLLSRQRHVLLAFEDAGRPLPLQPALAGTGDRLTVLRLDAKSDPRGAVRARYGQRGPGWVLVRPDQVVAARGNGEDLAGLARYLDRVVRETA